MAPCLSNMIYYKAMPDTNYSLVSLGCARTLVDSEKMVDDLNHAGFQLVAEGTQESITILNTCSFIQAAIDETESNINHLLSLKKEGSLKYVVVTGCYPSRFKRAELEAKYPAVDLWLSTQEANQLQPALTQLVFKEKFTPITPKPYTKLTPTHYAYLKISEGCNNWCSFCTIPKIRGEHTSKPLEDIIIEAKLQLSMGVKELILIAEDTTCWGEDIYGKPSLPLLLTELAKLPIPWIRVMYIFPPRVDDELIATIKNTPNIINYIDMPIQHVNSDLLLAMNRRHDRSFLEGIVRDLRQEIPDLSLRTSLILGFPGETEAHVQELMNFIEEYPFNHIGCFTYSEERETRSARYEHKVDMLDAHQRVDMIMAHQQTLVQDRYPRLFGETLQMIYEGKGLARSYREAPDVDSHITLTDTQQLQPGQFLQGTLRSSNGYDLIAEPI